MTTTHVRACDTEERWMLFDAADQPRGRMAVQIAFALMGKDRPTYQPSELCGAHVVVVNSKNIVLTGKKAQDKVYHHYTGYPGGLRETSVDRMRERSPNEIVRLAVRRMLPKTRLGKQMLSRLKIYEGAEHRHTAQQPVKVEIPTHIKA